MQSRTENCSMCLGGIGLKFCMSKVEVSTYTGAALRFFDPFVRPGLA